VSIDRGAILHGRGYYDAVSPDVATSGTTAPVRFFILAERLERRLLHLVMASSCPVPDPPW
jgi:hypothetical protein